MAEALKGSLSKWCLKSSLCNTVRTIWWEEVWEGKKEKLAKKKETHQLGEHVASRARISAKQGWEKLESSFD